MVYEKVYVITAERMESKEMRVLELLDESSTPGLLKTVVARVPSEEFLRDFGAAASGSKVKVTFDVVEKAGAPKQT